MSWKWEKKEREKREAQRRGKVVRRRPPSKVQTHPFAFEEATYEIKTRPRMPYPGEGKSLAERLRERRASLEYMSGSFPSYAEIRQGMERLAQASASAAFSTKSLAKASEEIRQRIAAAYEIQTHRFAFDEVVEEPKSPPPDPPRITGKVVAYRAWSLDGYRLRSANHAQHGGHWDFGPNRAECLIEKRRAYLRSIRDPSYHYVDVPAEAHDAPSPSCECGLYLYFEPGNANLTTLGPENAVWGAATAWGKIEVHAHGIRAEYAEPVVLAYGYDQPDEHVERIRVIAEEACVPFVPLNELLREAAKFGDEVPFALRPPRSDYYFIERATLPPPPQNPKTRVEVYEELQAAWWWSEQGNAQRLTVRHNCSVEGEVEVAMQLLEQNEWKCPVCKEPVP